MEEKPSKNCKKSINLSNKPKKPKKRSNQRGETNSARPEDYIFIEQYQAIIEKFPFVRPPAGSFWQHPNLTLAL